MKLSAKDSPDAITNESFDEFDDKDNEKTNNDSMNSNRSNISNSIYDNYKYKKQDDVEISLSQKQLQTKNISTSAFPKVKTKLKRSLTKSNVL